MILRFVLVVLSLLGNTELLRPQAQTLIEGTVLDADTKKPIPSVNISVRGQMIGTSTDSLGHFTLSIPKGPQIIAFSHVAYKKIIRAITADRQATLITTIEMQPSDIKLAEVVITAKKPFSEQRALYSLTGAEFERLGESDIDRAMRYLLPDVFASWDERMRSPSKDFTLYVNGEWKESLFLLDIDPFTIRRVLVWDPTKTDEGLPIGMPLRRGRHVVSIDTK